MQRIPLTGAWQDVYALSGTYHLQLQGMSIGNSTGVISLMWEELP